MNALSKPSILDNFIFDNGYLNELPADPETRVFPRQVKNAYYSRVTPAQVKKPQLAAYSREVAALLGLSEQHCETADFANVFAGNRLAYGMQPHATCYGGHQFGHWAGQLGDGRAINLGDVINTKGERWALQLKGAGLTPYSRTADGLAVLRSSVREFLCSEAMHHLGVPTTRALSLVLTGEEVIRDMFYNGNPKTEAGAIVCRVAPSFIRFGHFQIYAVRGELDILKQLADYTINTHFSHLGKPSPETYLAWFAEVCRSTTELIVHWQRVGFVHGVMNTDNMSILGLTIDYGPYGWLENYDPDWTPNTTDAGERRYRFANQPGIAFWNLAQFANAIYPLINRAEPLQETMHTAWDEFELKFQQMMAQKLGFNTLDPSRDELLQTELMALLPAVETDMTIFFRQLAELELGKNNLDDIPIEQWFAPLMAAYYEPDQLSPGYIKQISDWLRQYNRYLLAEGITQETRRERMNQVNPKYVLRNYMAQLAIDKAEQGDFSLIRELLDMVRHPYDEQPDRQLYFARRPDWARQRAGCSMLSCSS